MKPNRRGFLSWCGAGVAALFGMKAGSNPAAVPAAPPVANGTFEIITDVDVVPLNLIQPDGEKICRITYHKDAIVVKDGFIAAAGNLSKGDAVVIGQDGLRYALHPLGGQ